jgi:hypothetical protein
MLCVNAPQREPGCAAASRLWFLPGEGKAADVVAPVCSMHGAVLEKRGEPVRTMRRVLVAQRKARSARK